MAAVILASQLELIADALEGKSGASTAGANLSKAGQWLRITNAAEVLGGSSTAANLTVTGYMLRTAVALEILSGTSGAEENRSVEGYTKRIVEALEGLAGQTYTGSLNNRMVLASAGATFGAPTIPAITSANTFTTAEKVLYAQTATASGGGTKTWVKGGVDAVLVTLNTATGEWSLTGDFETDPSIVFTLTVTNIAGSSAPQTITVTITDVVEAAVPTNTTAPVITGEPIVGHTLYATPGVYTGSPTLTYQWKEDGVAILGTEAQRDFYEIQDSNDGKLLTVDETATNGAGVITVASSNNKAAAFAVISAPTALRTSVSAASPVTWNRTTGAGTYAGYYQHIAIASDASFTTLLWAGAVELTQAMIEGTEALAPETNGIPDLGFGVYDPAQTGYPAQVYIREYTFMVTPLGAIKQSLLSNVITKIIVVPTVKMDANTKTALVVLSNNDLTVDIANGGGRDQVMSNKSYSTGKIYFELAIVTHTGGYLAPGFVPSTHSAVTDWRGNNDAAIYETTNLYLDLTTLVRDAYTAGDRIMFAADLDANLIWVGKGGVWYTGTDPSAGTGGATLVGIPEPMFFGLNTGFGTFKVTWAFAAADFLYTIPTGFGAPTP